MGMVCVSYDSNLPTSVKYHVDTDASEHLDSDFSDFLQNEFCSLFEGFGITRCVRGLLLVGLVHRDGDFSVFEHGFLSISPITVNVINAKGKRKVRVDNPSLVEIRSSSSS